MGYQELIDFMQRKAGFTYTEAEEVLDLMVESISERLGEYEREDFARLLPIELQEAVYSAETSTTEELEQDFVHEFMDKEGIEEIEASKQVITAWETLKSIITDVDIQRLKAQLPSKAAASLQ
ncbi:MAG: DUF2267 domain-containing protein [Candidatus Nomurabacteria bacterium]|nr:MAG: DUF2267 domain-containing protein [Candidatus Nomurabacteria bacterium]